MQSDEFALSLHVNSHLNGGFKPKTSQTLRLIKSKIPFCDQKSRSFFISGDSAKFI